MESEREFILHPGGRPLRLGWAVRMTRLAQGAAEALDESIEDE